VTGGTVSHTANEVLTFQSLPVTWCTIRFNIQQLYVLPTMYLCVSYLHNVII